MSSWPVVATGTICFPLRRIYMKTLGGHVDGYPNDGKGPLRFVE
jgi:hypothetical protein